MDGARPQNSGASSVDAIKVPGAPLVDQQKCVEYRCNQKRPAAMRFGDFGVVG